MHVKHNVEKLSIKSEIKILENEYQNAVDGKDINCKKCDANGLVIEDMGHIRKGLLVNVPCECVSNKKSEIFTEIEKLKSLLNRYYQIFGELDDDFTLEYFASKFKKKELVEILKSFLKFNMPFSLLITGKSAHGKTTILKILWQILMLDGTKVYYLNSPKLEELAMQNIFNRNEAVQNNINSIITTAKKADVLLIDDHACFSMKYSMKYFYEIFDYQRANKNTLIMTSNKNYDEIVASYAVDKLMAERLASRLKGLQIIEVRV